MAIGPIGAVAYANQAMPALATKQTNFQNRLDMQNSVVATALDEKDKQVIEVRPAEETHKIDPEHEHEKDKRKEEEGENEKNHNKKQESEKQENEEVFVATHLDIKV